MAYKYKFFNTSIVAWPIIVIDCTSDISSAESCDSSTGDRRDQTLKNPALEIESAVLIISLECGARKALSGPIERADAFRPN